MIGIYKITAPDGKIYIGQSVDIEKRFRAHRNKSVIGKGQRLLNSFLSQGVENHLFEIITLCDKQELNKLERLYQMKYDVLSDNGLNDSYVGCEGQKMVYSERIKKTKSEFMKGKPSVQLGTTKTQAQKEHHRNHMLNKDSSASHKLVFHTELGIYFKNVREAAETFGYKQKGLSAYLRGERKNKTKLIYA